MTFAKIIIIKLILLIFNVNTVFIRNAKETKYCVLFVHKTFIFNVFLFLISKVEWLIFNNNSRNSLTKLLNVNEYNIKQNNN